MPNVAADMFRQAAELTRNDPRRQGNVVVLDEPCDMLVCGDIHGNRAALAKVLSCADLAHHPSRQLVLQEIAHGPPDERTGLDRSVEVLLRACRTKVQHDRQVLFLLANHDVAQITGNEITKGGRRICQGFDDGVRYAFEDGAAEVLEAIEEFLRSLPLAVRLPNRVWLSHTLPSPRRMELAGTEIFHRPYREEDFRRGGPVYEWTWGRNQTAEQIDALAEALDVDFFLLGHKRIDTGYELLSPRAMVVASDHAQAGVLQFGSGDPLDEPAAVASFRPVTSLGR